MIARRTFLTLTLAAFTLAIAPFASAEAEPPAQAFIRKKQEELMKLLKDGKPDTEVDKVFNSLLNYDVLAEASLGSEWGNRSAEEKAEFTRLLSQLVRNSYRKNLKNTLGYKISYTKTEKVDGRDVVYTEAENAKKPREEKVEINYILTGEGDQRRIVDVVTEKTSMVGSYRSNFTKVIKKDGFPRLIEKMKKKVASGSTKAD
ncbi:MAG TPA: ABC transporter substrate-binding protein [Polyangiaceae bacterium]|nr:ABC transporter substrate-binding protein [Polyangiaceae bacterium]